MTPCARKLFVSLAVCSAFVGLNAWADIGTNFGIPLGEFSSAGTPDVTNSRGVIHWAAFTLGGSFISDLNNQDDQEASDIYGDVGVGGKGDIKMGSGATLHGDLYWQSSGTLTMNGTSVITGNKHHDAVAGGPNDTILNQGVSDANRISTQAGALPATDNSITNVNGKNQNFSYTLTSTSTVLSLSNFTMSGGTFTLNGTAAQAIIINVANNFSLTSGAKIVLTGGLQWDSVLFNVLNPGNPVQLDNGQMTGILMANRRQLSIKNSSLIFGEAVANAIQIGSLSKIINPRVASP